MLHAVIMAGGAGTRFWPASRRELPKQFLPILGSKSMISLTMERLLSQIETHNIYVVTAADQVPLVIQHLPQLPPQNIIIEPFGMNTAPCLALSLAVLEQKLTDEDRMLVLPADHFIRDTEAFLESLELAHTIAAQNKLVTFGIIPDHPATGYGYIEAGDEFQPGAREVLRFKEKPDRETATGFIKQGNFYWNSGMFCWTLKTLRNAFQAHLPLALEVAQELVAAIAKGADDALVATIYAKMPRTPIDIGIMEKSQNRAVIPVDYGWSDVGSWQALSELSPSDAAGNTFTAQGIGIESQNNYIHSNKFTALIGVNDLCIIETEHAILVCPKNRSEEVKKVVDSIDDKLK